tara:strand:- start:597 stop:836 length:240 start_codon:yes stop_codon:yes gene_type:complete
MTYYLLLENDSESDTIFETNILGEESFKVFYPSLGFQLLHRLLTDKPELLKQLKIVDEQKKHYTITEFLDKLEKWKIKA